MEKANKTYTSQFYFQFFKDSELQESNDNNARDFCDSSESSDDGDDFFQDQELATYITFNRYLPQWMQDQVDSFSNTRVQLLTQMSQQNLNNIREPSSLKQAFNLLTTKYDSKGARYEVLASLTDFKPYIIGRKIRALETALTLDEVKAVQHFTMDNFQLADIVNHVLDQTKGKVDEQKAIRDIIDFQFLYTSRFFYFNLFLYTFGYFIPLIQQMKYAEKTWQTIRALNVSCLIVQLWCLFYECVTLYATGFKDYFSSVWNIIDWCVIMLYFVYFYIRREAVGSLIPTIPEDKFNRMEQADWHEWTIEESSNPWRYRSPVLHVLLIVTGFVKLMYYLKVNQSFGQFVQLVLTCIWDVRIFLFFFCSWVFVFAELFYVSGTTFSDDDYPTINTMIFYIQTFRNSVGDLAPPEYKYWKQMHYLDEWKSLGWAQMMIYMIWMIWFLNLFLNCIILLNFLIAIVSQSYDNVLTNSMNYMYVHKAELNIEAFRFFNFFLRPTDYDIMCTVSNIDKDDDDGDQQEVKGFTFQIKSYIKKQLLKMKNDIKSGFESGEKNVESVNKNLAKNIDQSFEEFHEGVGFIKDSIDSIKKKIGEVGVGGGAQPKAIQSNEKQLAHLIGLVQENQTIMKEEMSLLKKQGDANQKTMMAQQKNIERLSKMVENVANMSSQLPDTVKLQIDDLSAQFDRKLDEIKGP